MPPKQYFPFENEMLNVLLVLKDILKLFLK